jgi:uncharacterized RDD family membrane protein YckC
VTNPYAPPQAVVDDIIQPPEEMMLAERLTRLGAAILDSIIFYVAVFAPLMLTLFGASAPGSTTDDDGGMNSLAIAGVSGALVGFAIWSWFTLRYMIRSSQSIAKRFLDIKVVRSDGSRASVSRIIWLRNVVIWLLSLIPFLGAVVGVIDALFIFGESRQCLHDKIADTIVVKA